MQKIFTGICILVLALGLTASAQDKTAGKPQTVKGYIVDVMCGGDMTGSDAMAKAAKHERTCALKGSCAESGFGVMSDGKFYKFDDNGNTKAKSLLESSKKKSAPMAEVTGTIDGDKLAVSSMKEVKSMKGGKKMGKSTKKGSMEG